MRDRQRQKVLFSSLEDLTEAEMPYVTDETESQAADLFAGLLSERELELTAKNHCRRNPDMRKLLRK